MPTITYGDRVCSLDSGDLLIDGLQEDDDDVLVDLSQVGFVDPSGLVSLATACLEAIKIGNRVKVTPPDNVNVANYLLRMRFRDLLRDGGVRFTGSFATREVMARQLRDHLIELQAVTRQRASVVGQDLVTLGRAVGIDDRALRPVFLGLVESVDNALEHSERDSAIVAAQRYRAGVTRFRLEVAVADLGVGLRHTLRPRHAVPDDAAAVKLAVTKGVSRLAGSRRGNGLSDVIENVCSVTGGSFEIRSGEASLSMRQSHRFVRTHRVARDGVHVRVSVLGVSAGT